ncbi:MAG: plasmid mobilization relaxosome protein MobC [Erysipelotrichaceae bacterium]
MKKIEIKVRLTFEEKKFLDKEVNLTCLSREAYVRSLIKGYVPKAQPSENFYEVIAQLRAIGNNLNQIAMVANSTGCINHDVYKTEVANLRKEILEIRKIVCEPIKMDNGNNSNLGCK